jgi:hypothetical protein
MTSEGNATEDDVYVPRLVVPNPVTILSGASLVVLIDKRPDTSHSVACNESAASVAEMTGINISRFLKKSKTEAIYVLHRGIRH